MNDVEVPRLVLLVEDDQDSRDAMAELLGVMGVPVVTFGSGELALRWLESGGQPTLLVTDLLMMGGMNGLELIAAIRKLEPFRHLPAIILTGSPHDADQTVDAIVLSKPRDHERLVELARKHCEVA